MRNFRICKNKNDFYKIQYLIPSKKLLYFITIKAHWKDLVDFEESTYEYWIENLAIFENREDAEERIEFEIKYDESFRESERKYDMKNHDSWVCDE